MIVDTILNDFTWHEDGLSCGDTAKTYIAYKFIRELILDSHLYVTKVIGFHIKNRTVRSHTGTYIARNVQIGESYAEMMTLLSDKLFLSAADSTISIPASRGVLTVDEAQLNQPCEILYTDKNICRVLDGNCVLNLKLQTNCGYRNMQQNSAVLGGDYFPMNTYFNVNSYIRVLPMLEGDSYIKVRFCNGMKMSNFKTLLMQYKTLIDQQTIHEEEEAWVHSFEL